MSCISIIHNQWGDWDVWLALNDDSEPPDGECFVIGYGDSRADAIAAAIKDQEATIEKLQKLATWPSGATVAGGARRVGDLLAEQENG